MTLQAIPLNLKTPLSDTSCPGPHKAGQRLLRWQHSEICKNINARLFRKRARPEPASIPDNATIVERGRAVGAI